MTKDSLLNIRKLAQENAFEELLLAASRVANTQDLAKLRKAFPELIDNDIKQRTKQM